ncbi:MAG: hypothetical protein R3Y63_02655 [Eubacteriales bacterium]
MSLFKKDIDPLCIYCQHGRPLSQEEVACDKKGIMEATSHCRKFSYDPLKRVPPRPRKADFSGLSPEDFLI